MEDGLLSVLKHDLILTELSTVSVSAVLALRCTTRKIRQCVNDKRLTETLPNVIEALELRGYNPFTLCHYGDVDSMWLLMVTGLDPKLVNRVCLIRSC